MATKQIQDDERTKIGGALDIRGDRGTDDNDRATSGLTSEDDFEKFMEAEFTQTALPNPPALAGYHLVWLTTSSQYDSVQKRQRLGYQPVRQSEMPSFDASGGQSLAVMTASLPATRWSCSRSRRTVTRRSWPTTTTRSHLKKRKALWVASTTRVNV